MSSRSLTEGEIQKRKYNRAELFQRKNTFRNNRTKSGKSIVRRIKYLTKI